MTNVPVTPFYDSFGNRVTLGRRIGGGGEGDVYEILGNYPDTVAKIYKKPLSEQKQQKLLLMVKGCNEELKEISAWPTAVLYAKQGGRVVGFLMPKIAGCEPVHKVYGPTHRKEVFPHADWRFLVRTAKNLAAAFYVIHKFGYVIGDVNEGNILVSDKACVRLIDCDSFQVRSGSRLFPCEVGVMHFTPPEILAAKHFDMERTKNHDNFGLAILSFQLLFLGRHPYAGVYSGKEDMPIEKAILEYRFAYGKNAGARMMSPPPNSVGLNIVPSQVASLFESAFAETGARPGARPEAGEWWDAFEELEAKIRRCTSDSMHSYYTGLSACPWCRLEEQSGILIFLSADSITKIDLQREWQKVEAVVPPGPLPLISSGNFSARPEPLPRHIGRSLKIRSARLATASLLLVVSIIFTLGEILTDPAILVAGLILVIVLVLLPDEAAKEKQRRKTSLRSARYLWDLWNKKWVDEAGDATFHKLLSHLKEQKFRYEKIERDYRAAMVALEQTAKDRQLVQFLSRWSIETCTIPRLDILRKKALISAGINSAAGISPQALRRVPQIDNTLANELIVWRERTARTFLFDPSKGLEREQVQALIHQYQPMMKPVERELKTGPLKLHRIQEDVQKKRVMLRPQVEKRARELAQAEADYEVFARTMEEMVLQDIRGILGIRETR